MDKGPIQNFDYKDGKYTLTNQKGISQDFNAEVVNDMLDNSKYEEKLNAVSKLLSERDNLNVKVKDSNGNILDTDFVNKSDFNNLELVKNWNKNFEEKVIMDNVKLIVKAPDLEMTARWKVYFQDQLYEAAIWDKGFRELVLGKQIAFRNGDILVARILVNKDESKKIIEVLEVYKTIPEEDNEPNLFNT